MGEDTEKLVGDVLLELGEKPHVVAERLGRITVDTVPARNTRSAVKKRPRPVKICLTSSALARKILSRARDEGSSGVTAFLRRFHLPRSLVRPASEAKESCSRAESTEGRRSWQE